MTPEAMEKWDVGYLPSNARGMLRSKFVYALRNERSEKIGYVGRDLAFKEKLAKWEGSDRTGKAPIKAKFPPGLESPSKNDNCGNFVDLAGEDFGLTINPRRRFTPMRLAHCSRASLVFVFQGARGAYIVENSSQFKLN